MTYRGRFCGAGPVRGRGRATWAVLAILAVVPTVAGCYRPSIVDGKLECGPANACPDGFSCVSGHCWQGGIVSPPDGGSEDTGLPVDMSETEVACVGAVPGCTPSSTGVCDPVCQTGCQCLEKCSISSSGQAACIPVAGPKAPGDPCNVTSYGAPGQFDDCAPGAVCLYPGGTGSGFSYCFALCASDDTCPGSRCTPRPVAPPLVTGTPMAPVCDRPFEACNPFTNAGCADGFVCYLTLPDPASGASRTLCEYVPGSGRLTDTCQSSRECVAKFACPEGARPGAGFCLPVCDPTHPCSSGGTCKPYGSTYGYCVTT
jgi:hypothetical protein